MKSETDTIISALRGLARDGVANACLEEAATRLEELSKLLKSAKLDNDRYQKELMQYRCPENPFRPDYVKKDPSRLEIAAMLLAAMCGSQYTWTNAEELALRKADILIALAKEAK